MLLEKRTCRLKDRTFVADTDHVSDWSFCNDTLARDQVVFPSEGQSSTLKRLANVNGYYADLFSVISAAACIALFLIQNTKRCHPKQTEIL